jgi:hypothetical protein
LGEEIGIEVIERRIDGEREGRGFDAGGQPGRHQRFQLQLDFVGELVAGVADHFQAVVMIWIVRCGDHDASNKRTCAGEVGDAGGGDDTGEAGRDADARETASDLGSQPRTAFARVHADQDFGGGAGEIFGMGALRPGAERDAQSVGSRRIERWFPGYATNPVGSEKLSGQNDPPKEMSAIYYCDTHQESESKGNYSTMSIEISRP